MNFRYYKVALLWILSIETLFCFSTQPFHLSTIIIALVFRKTSALKFFSSKTIFSSVYSSSKMSEFGKLIDGNVIAAQIRVELQSTVKDIQESLDVTPGLAVVLVGARRDSATYVRMKKKACAEVGVTSFGFDFPADITQEELIAKVDELNNGIITTIIILILHSIAKKKFYNVLEIVLSYCLF